ncbi:AfsR/SARP family transcriptional regulator [Micromonospora matsumotoense]|uniref:AfsR/SARP family transcriptional regulator n=1 Tax=Micromonospora matsumotoense TaxID=121616 RepID=UPI0034221681
MPVRYLLLGPLQVIGETPQTITAPKIETLLATLLIRANQPVPAEDLITELWGEHPPRRVRAALHVYVSHIRKRFTGTEPGTGVLHTHGQGYLLEVADARIDVTELQVEYARGRALAGRNPAAALAAYGRAVALFRGPVLSGIRNGSVVNRFGRWADEVRLECLEGFARTSLTVGRHRELIGELTQWTEEYPLHEPLREQLMLSLYRAGRRGEALAAFHRARQVLREELGLEPRESMRRLQSDILTERVLPLAS